MEHIVSRWASELRKEHKLETACHARCRRVWASQFQLSYTLGTSSGLKSCQSRKSGTLGSRKEHKAQWLPHSNIFDCVECSADPRECVTCQHQMLEPLCCSKGVFCEWPLTRGVFRSLFRRKKQKVELKVLVFMGTVQTVAWRVHFAIAKGQFMSRAGNEGKIA